MQLYTGWIYEGPQLVPSILEGLVQQLDRHGFRTISEAAVELDVPQHVLRFWETRFSQIKPMKRGGGRRYYRRDDVDLLRGIRHLLYGQGFTIRGQGFSLSDGLTSTNPAVVNIQVPVTLADGSALPADIVITATGNKDIITAGHMERMKHQAIVGNIGHFDNEIDMAGLARLPGIERINVKPQVDEWVFPDGHSVIVLSEGRLLNLGNATGHPSFVMSNSFSNQVIAQIELWTKPDEYDNEVYRLPKHLDEKVAKIHVEALGGTLTKLTKDQAEYIGVDVEGPYKPEHYRY